MPRIYGSTERTIASDEAVETARNITRFTLVSAFPDPLAPLAARADLPTCLGHAWTAQVGRTRPHRAEVRPTYTFESGFRRNWGHPGLLLYTVQWRTRDSTDATGKVWGLGRGGG